MRDIYKHFKGKSFPYPDEEGVEEIHYVNGIYPYDHQEYHWARSRDKNRWMIARRTTRVEVFIGTELEVAKRLEELNAPLKSMIARD
jgi:hypothetical protein